MFKYLRALIVCGPRIIWSYFAWMIKYAKNPSKYPLEVRYNRLRNLILFVYKSFGVKFIYKNEEIFKKQNGKFVLFCNHLSYADALNVIAISEKPITFVAKKEAEKMPFIGKCIKMLEGIFLDRGDLKKEAIEILRAVKMIKQDYISVCVFPEGTRNKNPLNVTAEFKAGSLKVAEKSRANLVVAASYGSFRILSAKYTKHDCPVYFTFVDELTFENFEQSNTIELASRLQVEVANEVELLKKTDSLYFHNKEK